MLTLERRQPTRRHCATITAVVSREAPERMSPPSDGLGTSPIGEPRWPPVAALLLFLVLNIGLRLWLPRDRVFAVPWLMPSVELLLLVVLLAADPGSVVKRRRRLHRVSLALVSLLVLGALWATSVLIYHLITGAEVTEDPGSLLAAGALVWLGNNLSFALFYWLMDGGGPIMRAQRPAPVDFAFTQHMSPELAPPGWRPVFLDYLHLGFTNATAFSPTDVMPLSHRAKYTMVVQATIALALFGLIVARAVNAFT